MLQGVFSHLALIWDIWVLANNTEMQAHCQDRWGGGVCVQDLQQVNLLDSKVDFLNLSPF